MRLAALIAVSMLAGCAAGPQAPAAPAAAPVAAATPATPAPASTAKATTPPPGGITPELYAQAKQQGYQAKVYKGETLFCRNEAPIGSRLAKDVCVRPSELENVIRQAQDVRDQMNRGQTCGKAACGGT